LNNLILHIHPQKVHRVEQVERLKSMGVGSVVFDPCGNVPEQGDFFTVMQQNVENLKMVFK